jgi:group I intron endonuclease
MLTCIPSGKEYIGQTIYTVKKRWKDHKSAANTGKLGKLKNAIRKHGSKNFTAETIWICSTDLDDLNYWETHFIAERMTFKYGYNSTIGGQGCQGSVCSEETKLKRSIANKGKLPALREKYDHHGNQLPMYITYSNPKPGFVGYKVRNHPFFDNLDYKSVEFTAKSLTLDEKLQMAFDVLKQLNDGTFVSKTKKTNVIKGVQILKKRGTDVVIGYQVAIKVHKMKMFTDSNLTIEEKLNLANEYALNIHNQIQQNKVQ